MVRVTRPISKFSGPSHIFLVVEARHVKFVAQIDHSEYNLMHVKIPLHGVVLMVIYDLLKFGGK